jgi:histidinol-phosphate aminotransferase
MASSAPRLSTDHVPAAGASIPANAPAVYTWEATDEQVSQGYGVPLEDIVRFDLNTSPAPPDFVAKVLAAGRFETAVSEYPPSDYRRLTAAAASRYQVDPGEIVVGAGADEVLDMIARAFLQPGARAVIPVPSYAMYRVVTEQRTGRVIAVPRLGADAGHAVDVEATRVAARQADLVWLCSPNNPTALAEPDGAVATLLEGLGADAADDDRIPPAVCLDEAYAEFTGTTLLPLRARYSRLIVVRTLSKAYALAGLRVGFAIARRETLTAIEPYRPPGSVSTVSVTVATEALRDSSALEANRSRIVLERERLAAALAALGWSPGPSVTNFLLVGFGSRERATDVTEYLLHRGLVPRTFPSTHPLADHLRITVRSPLEDDRLIAAARSFEAGNPRSAG